LFQSLAEADCACCTSRACEEVSGLRTGLWLFALICTRTAQIARFDAQRLVRLLVLIPLE